MSSNCTDYESTIWIGNNKTFFTEVKNCLKSFYINYWNQEECKAAGLKEECWKCYLYNECSVNTLKIILNFLTIFFALFITPDKASL